jgi:P-type Cu2+ transporter
MLQLSAQTPETNAPQQPVDNIKTATLDIEGMKCAGCVTFVEKQLLQNIGTIDARVNLITGVGVIRYDAKSLNPETLTAKLTTKGFPSQLRQTRQGRDYLKLAQQKRQQAEKQQLQQLITAACLLIFSSLGHLEHMGFLPLPLLSNIWLHWGLATLALLLPGRTILSDGWRSFWHLSPNMNGLIALGTTTAYLASCFALFLPQLGWECFFDEPVMLLGFIFLGRVLEQKAKGRASAALEVLTTLQPPIARLTAENRPSEAGIEIPVDQLRVGEWVRVLVGEKIPVDGDIVAGETSIDESMLTGEANPVVKTLGSQVSAGTLNLTGIISVRVSRVGAETTIAQILRLVEEAQTRKAPIQKLADTISGYFAWGVTIFALSTWLFWYFLGTNIYPEVLSPTTLTNHLHQGHLPMATTSPLLLSLKLAISTLVVACPCALGLATPTAILVGTSIGAERGILIKGGDILEKMQKLETIIFDKTGTLTLGYPSVTDCLPLTAIPAEKILQIAAAVENNSNHPLAKSIVRHAHSLGLDLPEIDNFRQENGFGTSATMEGKQVNLGSWEWLKTRGIAPSAQLLNLGAAVDQTLVYIALEQELIGIIALEDQLRPDALMTVQKLKQMGLRLLLVSGDRREVVESIAQKLEITEIFAQKKPKEKVEIVENLQQENPKGTIAVVGDGINDAPALAAADLGISLTGGTDVALETADIVLMSSSTLDRSIRLSDIVTLINLSHATVRKIRQNLIWAFTYNLVALPLAAGILLPHFGILLSPSIAAALMISSSLLVVTNSLSLFRRFAANQQHL